MSFFGCDNEYEKYYEGYNYPFNAFKICDSSGNCQVAFDFWFDGMPSSKTRNPQYVLNLSVQKIAESWAFSAFSLGPSLILSEKADGKFGVLKIFVNLRLKIGSSL